MNVGLIGLGAMGRGMAASLRRASHEVHVFDVRAEAVRDFVAAGGAAHESPASVASACDVLISVVVNAEQTESLLFGAQGAAAAMRRGNVFVMCSTVDPSWSIALEKRLEALGVLYLDAPISGGAAKAAAGEITMMTAGRAEAYARCEGVLEAMAARVYKLGDRAGPGSTVKIVNQLLAGVHIAAAAEAMALGIRAGADPAAVYEVITHSAGNSWMFENRMAHVLSGDYTPLSAVDIFVKDLGIVLDTARASKFPLPLAATAHQMFMQASSAGHGKEDDAAVIKIFPGIELPSPQPSPKGEGEREMSLILGCIADDSTGATDLANNLVRAGMRVVQTIGVPKGPIDEEVDAVVVALKTRTCPVAEAVGTSLEALEWLRGQGAQQVYFKYCSTFDSTPRGNIGPVCEALMKALSTDFTIACPAFPENKRVVFKGYLFAGDVLLNESSMRNHPLTPMTDPNIVRVLQAQTKRKVGLLDYNAVMQGAEVIERQIAALRAGGVGIAIVDVIADADFARLAPMLRKLPLITGGSGMAIALPAAWGIELNARAAQLSPPTGYSAIVSGSCSTATRGQVGEFVRTGGASLALDPIAKAEGKDVVGGAIAWARERLAKGPVLIYSTATPEAVSAVQSRMGADVAGALVEKMLADVARGLVDLGVRRLVVAGGETASAVLHSLGVERLRIGPQIDPGVPWCSAYSNVVEQGMHIALKSGNFGTPDFFLKALAMLDDGAAPARTSHG